LSNEHTRNQAIINRKVWSNAVIECIAKMERIYHSGKISNQTRKKKEKEEKKKKTAIEVQLEIAYPSDHVLDFHVDRCSTPSTTAIPPNCCTVIPKHFSGRSEFQPTRKIQAIGLARKPWSSGVQPPRCFGQPRDVVRLHDAGSSPTKDSWRFIVFYSVSNSSARIPV
jgi:hypothetical protein